MLIGQLSDFLSNEKRIYYAEEKEIQNLRCKTDFDNGKKYGRELQLEAHKKILDRLEKFIDEQYQEQIDILKFYQKSFENSDFVDSAIEVLEGKRCV